MAGVTIRAYPLLRALGVPKQMLPTKSETGKVENREESRGGK